jgi:hypothetical protein
VIALLFVGSSITPGGAAFDSAILNRLRSCAVAGLNRATGLQKVGLLIHSGVLKDKDHKDSDPRFKPACKLGNIVGCQNASVGFECAQHGLTQNYEQACGHLPPGR